LSLKISPHTLAVKPACMARTNIGIPYIKCNALEPRTGSLVSFILLNRDSLFRHPLAWNAVLANGATFPCFSRRRSGTGMTRRVLACCVALFTRWVFSLVCNTPCMTRWSCKYYLLSTLNEKLQRSVLRFLDQLSRSNVVEVVQIRINTKKTCTSNDCRESWVGSQSPRT